MFVYFFGVISDIYKFTPIITKDILMFLILFNHFNIIIS